LVDGDAAYASSLDVRILAARFLGRLGQAAALCSSGAAPPAAVVVKRAAEQPPLHPDMSAAHWNDQTCATAGFDDADTGTAARTVGAADVRRRLASAVSGVGCIN
jgi:hypothetical protein